MENVRKQRYQTCNNRKEKKLFGVRTKLSYYKVFQRNFVGYRSEKNSDTYEQICLFRFIYIKSE